MDTFDTIRFISDTILVKTSEMANNSQSIMENKGAGWTDVLITFFVCATIAIIAIYGFI